MRQERQSLWQRVMDFPIRSSLKPGAHTPLKRTAQNSKRMSCPPFSCPKRMSYVPFSCPFPAPRAIELTEKLIAAKQKRKQALMQQLLTGKVRFKEFEGKPWKEMKLGELFNERKETNHIDLPLLSITASAGIVFRDTLERKDSSNADKSKYLRICPGDIGYNTMRMWQGVSALSAYEGIVSPAYTICTPGPHIDAVFASYLFKFPSLVHLFWRYSQGLVNDTLNLKFDSFSLIKVEIPSLEEQAKIGHVFSCVDAELRKHELRVEQLQQQKKGLMQQLLTGKVRVKGDAEAVKV
jgi:type I restriction enzyme S subunit